MTSAKKAASETRPCPRCGAGLSNEAPQGLCVPCLLEAGLYGEVGGPPEETDGKSVGPPAAPPGKTGERVGRYKLLERIGEGGCGVVYLAEQDEPVRRRVALKVIKLGMDTRQVVARFEAERQALALMEHPNIAKVLDGGATEDGRPYFVMEYVRGVRITDYCDQSNLPLSERLKLVIKVCRAIQHAHQKGIIHRDIKPSNILVTTLQDESPEPKVIDFGIAKAMQGRLTDATVHTQAGEFIGTPAYVSPEQAESRHEDIDTRTDIYAVGVLLYELMTGMTPFSPGELAKLGLDEMRRTISEREPPRPSVRLETMPENKRVTAATNRGCDPVRLIRLVRGDLDWIVVKCLEKDRTRRYSTMDGLALDIQRHLNEETILAHPPSDMYRLWKLFRRNKVTVGATAAAALGMVAALAISTWMYIRERRADKIAVAERDISDRSRQSTDNAMTFLEDIMFAADTYQLKGQTLDIDVLLRRVEFNLPGIQDLRTRALVFGDFGRVASDWDRFALATNWLEQSASCWAKLAAEKDTEEGSRAANEKLATVLNQLAWAILGDASVTNGRDARARQAMAPAKRAYDIQLAENGPADEGTHRMMSDWIRMRQLSGDPMSVAAWFELIASTTEVPETELIQNAVETVHETVRLARRGELNAAKERIRALIIPLLKGCSERMRRRIPWDLAQQGNELPKVLQWAPVLSSKASKFAPLATLTAEELAATRPVVMDCARDLGNEILEPGHPDRAKIQQLIQASKSPKDKQTLERVFSPSASLDNEAFEAFAKVFL